MEAPKQRPRSKSTFSFKSDKSEKSSKAPKLPKEKLTESAAEKHQNHLSTTTKANPNAAMEEAQPSTMRLVPFHGDAAEQSHWQELYR